MDLIELSLLPPEYETARRDFSWAGDRRIIYPVLMILIVIVVIFMAWLHINDELEQLQASSRALDAEIKKNKPLLKQITDLKAKLAAIDKKNTALKSIQVSRLRWIIVLENISTTLPKNMWVDRIVQDASNSGILKIDGITYNFPEIAEYMLRLGEQESMSSVELVSISRIQQKGNTAFRFSMRCVINKELGLESAN